MKRRDFVRGLAAAAVVPVPASPSSSPVLWVGPSGPTIDRVSSALVESAAAPTEHWAEFVEWLLGDVTGSAFIPVAVLEELAADEGGEA